MEGKDGSANPAAPLTTYDEIPYESHSFPQSHPDRLATIGRLFGMKPTPVTKCRVLELGCASGGNLIPMAFQLPDSEFVGIDYSRRHVEAANKTIGEMDIENVRIEYGSILGIDETWGKFDYIVCHGVYSWVPDAVQEKILAVCRANLAKMGIAYVSYNTYPGWHMREMIRHMMIYHTAQFPVASKRIEQARALIDFLARSVPTQDNPYGLLLKNELELIHRSKDYYLFHDHLEEVNRPLYFHEFIERSEKQGLQYLGEAEFNTMLSSGFPTKVAETLKRISSQITQTEQYMDFLRNRMFRQTILCHRGTPLNRNLGPDDIEGFLIASAAAPDGGAVNMNAGVNCTFKTPAGATLQTSRPLTKAAFLILKQHWPRTLNIDVLMSKALEKLREAGLPTELDAASRKTLLTDLLQCYSANLVELHTWQADFAPVPGDRPKVSPLASYQIRQGLPVVNQRHEAVAVDIVAHQLIPFLDGTRDRAALLVCLDQAVKNGALVIRNKDVPISNPAVIHDSLDKALSKTLDNLAVTALLV